MGGFPSLEPNAAFRLWEHKHPWGVWVSRAVNRWEGVASRAGEASGPDLPTWAFEGPCVPRGQAGPEVRSFLVLTHHRPQKCLLGLQVI